MKKIQCAADIRALEQSHSVPAELIEHIFRDLEVVYEWSVPDQEVTFENFHTDEYDYGYIAILEGTESTEELERELSLTGGYENTTPESAEIYHWGTDKWVRVIVIYNDSYSMVLWIRNYDGYDSYAVDVSEDPHSYTQQAPF